MLKPRLAIPVFFRQPSDRPSERRNDNIITSSPKPEEPAISLPKSFRHGVHVSCHDGQLTGVPQAWQDKVDWGGQVAKAPQGGSAKGDCKEEEEALPEVIRPTAQDLRPYYKKQMKELEQGTTQPTSPKGFTSLVGSVRFRLPFKAGGPAVVGVEERLQHARDAATMGKITQEDLKALATETKVMRVIREAIDGVLDLSSCDIDGLADDWFVVNRELARTLWSVDLGFNRFQWFPLQLLRFKHSLTVLRLDGNQLSELPPHIGLLPHLEELSANGNQLESLTPSIGHCTALVRLELKHNRIKKLPRELGRLTQLEELYLSGNQVAALPRAIGLCTRLQVLDLSFCQVKRLPDEITHVTSLLQLNLAHNNLTALPDAFGLLTRLGELDVSYNLLDDFPLSMGHLSPTRFLCDNNPLRGEPRLLDLLGLGASHLLAFLETRFHSSLPVDEQREDFLAQLRERQPVASPVACPPLPAMPFRFTSSSASHDLPGQASLATEEKERIKAVPVTTLFTKPVAQQPVGNVPAAQLQRGSDSDTSSSPSSPDIASPVSGQPAAATEWLMQAKLNELKTLARILVIAIIDRVEDIQSAVRAITTLEEGIVLAKRIHALKNVMVAIRQHDEICLVSDPLKVTRPLVEPSGEEDRDRLLFLQQTLATALDNVSITAQALGRALTRTDDFEKLFAYASHLKALYTGLSLAVSSTSTPDLELARHQERSSRVNHP